MENIPKKVRIATRESLLALTQTGLVAAALRARHPGLEVEVVGMTTKGDRILDRPLSQVGGKGLFVKELELALEEDRADVAVHSMKDVPMELPRRFTLATFGPREAPLDAFVSGHFASLAQLPARSPGHGAWHRSRHPAAHLRSVLHDQGGRPGHRAWPRHHLWDRAGTRRDHPGDKRGGGRRPFHDRSAGGGVRGEKGRREVGTV